MSEKINYEIPQSIFQRNIPRQRYENEKLNANFYKFIIEKKPKYVNFEFDGKISELYYKTCSSFVIFNYKDLEFLPKEQYYTINFDKTNDFDVIISTIIKDLIEKCDLKNVKYLYSKTTPKNCSDVLTYCVPTPKKTNYFMFEYKN